MASTVTPGRGLRSDLTDHGPLEGTGRLLTERGNGKEKQDRHARGEQRHGSTQIHHVRTPSMESRVIDPGTAGKSDM